MAIFQLGDDDEFRPRIAAGAWVADSATVIGRVELHDEASVWYGAVLRGDNERITLGARSNVQEHCVLHTDPGRPLVIGSGVTVGHQAMLHGCTIGDDTLIGIQAVVLNGARIGRGCLVGAGAVVTENQEFPDHSLILGAPARLVRPVSTEQQASILRSAAGYVAKAARHRVGLKRIDTRIDPPNDTRRSG